MKADLSRDTFDRALHYSAVRLQQGRIVTDADWNEQADLTRYRAERQARDIDRRLRRAAGRRGLRAGRRDQRARGACASTPTSPGSPPKTARCCARRTAAPTGRWSTCSTAAHLRAIATRSAASAGLVGDGGVVRKTTDHGATWIAQDAGTLQTLRGVAVFDADHAWAVGDGGIVVATSDGGATWSLAQTEARAALCGALPSTQLNGLAVGQRRRDRRHQRRRRRPGPAWRAARPRTCARSPSSARRVSGRPGQGGTILRSTDAGATWLPCTTPTAATLHAHRASATRTKAGRPATAASLLHTHRRRRELVERGRRHGTATLRGLVVLRQRAGLAGRRLRRRRCASAAARRHRRRRAAGRQPVDRAGPLLRQRHAVRARSARLVCAPTRRRRGRAARAGRLPDLPRCLAAPHLGARSAGDPRGRARRPRHRDARAHDRAGACAAAAGDQPVRLELRFDVSRRGTRSSTRSGRGSPRAPSRSSRRPTCARSPRPPATGGWRTSSIASRCTKAARTRRSSGRARTARSPMRSSSVSVDSAQQQTTVRRRRARPRRQSRPRGARPRRAGRRRCRADAARRARCSSI